MIVIPSLHNLKISGISFLDSGLSKCHRQVPQFQGVVDAVEVVAGVVVVVVVVDARGPATIQMNHDVQK